MRVVEKKMIDAIINQKNLSCDNTKVVSQKDNVEVYLFDNLICKINRDFVDITNCGYKTSTTKSRLNSILLTFVKDRFIYQKKHEWYIVSTNLDGRWTIDSGKVSQNFPSGWTRFLNKFILNSFIASK